MSMHSIIPNSRTRGAGAYGFSLIEVLLAVVVLSVGLLALASLQAALTRGAAEAKAQSVAISLAEDSIEGLRDFTTPAEYTTGLVDATDCFDIARSSVSCGAATKHYTRAMTVERFCATAANTNYTTCTEGSATEEFSDFKAVTVDVSWTGVTGVQHVVLRDIVSDTQPSDTGHITTDVSLDRKSVV